MPIVAPIAPPLVTPLPTPPTTADPTNFDTRADSFLGGLPTNQTQMNALGSNVYDNAVKTFDSSNITKNSADLASSEADRANQRANAASTSASNAANSATDADNAYTNMQKLYLGAKTTPPTVDNQGNPLQMGAWYTNIGTGPEKGFWFWWSGTTWIVGVGNPSVVNWTTQVTGKPTTVVGYGITDAVRMLTGESLNTDYTVSTRFFEGTVATASSKGYPTLGGVSTLPLAFSGISLGTATRTLQIVGQSQYPNSNASGLFYRSKFDTTTGVWNRISVHAEFPVATTGELNCSAGNYFTIASATSPVLSFSNEQLGAYSCVLELFLVGGSITLPAGTLLNEPTPPIVAGKRYLIFFQKSSLVFGRWFASVLQFS